MALRGLCSGVVAGFILLTLLAPIGCSDKSKRDWRYRTPEQNYRSALEAQNPDERRDGVVRIAESRYVDSEPAFAVLDTAARTDPAAPIRCIAIRAFARYRDDRPVGTLLTILQAKEGSEHALPADDEVRWEVTRTLRDLQRKGLLVGPQSDLAGDLFIKLLNESPARNVRIAAAEALGAFKNTKVFAPLIKALRSRDFALADQAERSLISLTGVTCDYDPAAWEQWLANHAEPFAKAGQHPRTTQPAGPPWWDQQKRMWRKALKLGE